MHSASFIICYNPADWSRLTQQLPYLKDVCICQCWEFATVSSMLPLPCSINSGCLPMLLQSKLYQEAMPAVKQHPWLSPDAREQSWMQTMQSSTSALIFQAAGGLCSLMNVPLKAKVAGIVLHRAQQFHLACEALAQHRPEALAQGMLIYCLLWLAGNSRVASAADCSAGRRCASDHVVSGRRGCTGPAADQAAPLALPGQHSHPARRALTGFPWPPDQPPARLPDVHDHPGCSHARCHRELDQVSPASL